MFAWHGSSCQICAPVSLPLPKTVSSPQLTEKVLALAPQTPALAAAIFASYRIRRHVLHNHQKEEPQEGKENKQDDSMSAAMIGTIGFYKRVISPLLPPACRFVPTCSQYGVQAITEFGSTKGCILIAWRLLRCSPIGGKGYDPPKWPPVPYTYSSY